MTQTLAKTNNLVCSHSKKKIAKGTPISMEVYKGEITSVLCLTCPGCKQEMREINLLDYELSMPMEW